ncbi:hypothetical protein [Solibacillus cecembensis]|uniref:hypothetical protein n=1 Tax=Solibacillus cecembensis TaxID=459347 RepID=UPI003D08E2AD
MQGGNTENALNMKNTALVALSNFEKNLKNRMQLLIETNSNTESYKLENNGGVCFSCERKKPFNDVGEHYQKNMGGIPSNVNLKKMPKSIQNLDAITPSRN